MDIKTKELNEELDEIEKKNKPKKFFFNKKKFNSRKNKDSKDISKQSRKNKKTPKTEQKKTKSISNLKNLENPPLDNSDKEEDLVEDEQPVGLPLEYIFPADKDINELSEKLKKKTKIPAPTELLKEEILPIDNIDNKELETPEEESNQISNLEKEDFLEVGNLKKDDRNMKIEVKNTADSKEAPLKKKKKRKKAISLKK